MNINQIKYADGQTVNYTHAGEGHPIHEINPEYAESVKITAEPLQGIDRPEELRRLIHFPLLEAARALQVRGIKTCDSSPFEDRTGWQGKEEQGVWAYVAIYWDELNSDKQQIINKIINSEDNIYSQGEQVARMVRRGLPNFSGEEIPGVYFETKILKSTNPEIVNDVLVGLVEKVISRKRIKIN